jgi:hypothetical protein
MNQVRKQRLIGARVMIEGYVCNLLNKLDFKSRAQIVTWLATARRLSSIRRSCGAAARAFEVELGDGKT